GVPRKCYQPYLGVLQPDQDTDPVAATKAVPPLPEATGSRSAVNQLPKSVVRENRTLRSVGAGGGRLPPATRWALSNERPYRNQSSWLVAGIVPGVERQPLKK